MSVTRHLNVTLPAGLADSLAQKVSAGEYADASSAIEQGLIDLFANDGSVEPDGAAVEDWLINEVVPAYKYLQAHPESGLTLEEVEASLAAQRASSQQ